MFVMGNRKLLEYYVGNPDTVRNVNDFKSYSYTNSPSISFGFFQTSIDGEKEMLYAENTPHENLAEKAAKKLIGKALSHFELGWWKKVTLAVYGKAERTGRIFLQPKVLATWRIFSSDELRQVVSELGDVIGDMYEYTYVADNLDNSMNLVEYMNGNYEGQTERRSGSIDAYVDSKIIDCIKEYNGVAITNRDKELSKVGMTKAEYNWWKRRGLGDSIESKKVMEENKEVDMKNKMINEEFANYISIMREALENNDFKAYEYVRDMLDEAIEDKKHEAELMQEMNTVNFGVLNHIFEQELPTLIKTNKKAVRNVIKTIKEDKNLLGQFNFYHIIKEEYKGDVTEKIDEKTILDKLVKIVSEDIDLGTVKASNNKLRKVMRENKIVPSNFVDDDSKALYESGNIILTRKKTASNTIPLIESYDAVCKYMEAHKNDSVKKKVDVDELVREFEEKLKTNLNESEMSFVKQITDFKSPMAEQRKEKLFNKFKNECITKVNEMLKEDSSNAGLISLKAQLDGYKFNNESIVKDIAKLLEIRDILMEK